MFMAKNDQQLLLVGWKEEKMTNIPFFQQNWTKIIKKYENFKKYKKWSKLA